MRATPLWFVHVGGRSVQIGVGGGQRVAMHPLTRWKSPDPRPLSVACHAPTHFHRNAFASVLVVHLPRNPPPPNAMHVSEARGAGGRSVLMTAHCIFLCSIHHYPLISPLAVPPAASLGSLVTALTPFLLFMYYNREEQPRCSSGCGGVGRECGTVGLYVGVGWGKSRSGGRVLCMP